MADPAVKPIQLLALDVDGVLTDGGILLNDHGLEAKRFHVRDGTGLKIWTALGYEIAVITGRSGMAVEHRARELGIRHVVQRVRDKGAALRGMLDDLGLDASQVAAIGDDLPDLPLMRHAGYPMAVADAVAEVRGYAAFVTVRPGGLGAVRECVEHLLKAKDRWDEALHLFES
jgi:3-deoxy-D-manno-octulosonate 8-phosphate phosphatase (KDO 8-P phosphatase)